MINLECYITLLREKGSKFDIQIRTYIRLDYRFYRFILVLQTDHPMPAILAGTIPI